MTNTENVKKPAKTPRVDMPCQPAAVRAHNFKVQESALPPGVSG